MLTFLQTLLNNILKRGSTTTPQIITNVNSSNVIPVVVDQIEEQIPEINMTKQLVTIEVLRQLFPTTPKLTLEPFIEPLNRYCSEYQIDTRNKLASFLAQVGHESTGFSRLRENMNYSADALRKTFPKYFPTDTLAKTYERNPIAIGNRVYANRMGNGPESSGDGYKHRGFGAIQLTGKTNQSRFAFDIKKTLDQTITYLQTPEGAIHGAVWFWKQNNLNVIASRGEAGMVDLTQKINGGQIGYLDRLSKFKKAYKLLDYLP